MIMLIFGMSLGSFIFPLKPRFIKKSAIARFAFCRWLYILTIWKLECNNYFPTGSVYSNYGSCNLGLNTFQNGFWHKIWYFYKIICVICPVCFWFYINFEIIWVACCFNCCSPLVGGRGFPKKLCRIKVIVRDNKYWKDGAYILHM